MLSSLGVKTAGLLEKILCVKCFDGFQIVPVDNHILATVIFGVLAVLIKTILPVKYPEGHLLMVVDDLLFSNPFQCCGMGRSSLSLLS